MPEIVEVKMYTDFITNNIKNNKLLDINILKGRYKTHGPFEHYRKIINSLPLEIIEINTKGKFMYMKLKEDLYIGVSLGLMGGWFFRKKNKTLVSGVPPEDITKLDHVNFTDQVSDYIERAKNHLNLEFVFENGSLFYYDQLSFGSFIVYNKIEIEKKLKKLGVDIMDVSTTLDLFIDKFKSKTNLKKQIGVVLLNQRVIAGIGNYLRADLLWLCRISPFREIKDITLDEFELLFKNIRLLTWSVYDYKRAIKLKILDKKDKLPVNYKDEFLVYYRNKDIYGNEIKKERLYEGNQIRYIYWVPKLQK